MKNINSPSDFTELIMRLRHLSESNEKKWGKMNLQEMLIHCTAQLKLALGEIKSSPQGSFMMRTALGKWIAFSNVPWPKEANTPIEMNVHKNNFSLTDIESEKKQLLLYLDKVNSEQQLMPHPFFGALSKQEWGRLIYKHIDHHLKQFVQ